MARVPARLITEAARGAGGLMPPPGSLGDQTMGIASRRQAIRDFDQESQRRARGLGYSTGARNSGLLARRQDRNWQSARPRLVRVAGRGGQLGFS